MDTTQSDENALLASDPLDVVEHVLTAENLPFDRTEDGDLAFCLAGDGSDGSAPPAIVGLTVAQAEHEIDPFEERRVRLAKGKH